MEQKRVRTTELSDGFKIVIRLGWGIGKTDFLVYITLMVIENMKGLIDRTNLNKRRASPFRS